MPELWWHRDLERLVAAQGGSAQEGRILPLACHNEGGVLVRVFKDDPAHPGQAVLHVLCRQCGTAVADILTPRAKAFAAWCASAFPRKRGDDDGV